MKIHFRKHECDFFLGDAVSFENAKWVKGKYNADHGKKITICITSAICIVYVFLFSKQLSSHTMLAISIYLLLLPSHELCHALFAWIFGYGAEGIYFFPLYEKRKITNPSAYVCNNPVLWNKTKATLVTLFPLILLSVLPSLLALIFRYYAVWLIFIALLNLSCSSLDINNAISKLTYPRETIFLRGIRLLPKDVTKPTQIHYIYVHIEKGEKKVFHEHYEYYEGKSKRIEPPVETEDVLLRKNDLMGKLGLDI